MTLTFTIHKRIASRLSTKCNDHDGRDAKAPNNVNNFSEKSHKKEPSDSIPIVSSRDTPLYFPNPKECRVHLKLLKSLAELRSDVTISESGVTGVENGEETASHSETERGRPDSEDEEWKVYVSQASTRFQRWWVSVAPERDCVRNEDIREGRGGRLVDFESRLDQAETFVWAPSNLPPLDVLMTLHAFMLNPRCFMKDCVKYNMLSLWKAGLPWDLLDDYIHNSTYHYDPPVQAQRNWTERTGCYWDPSQVNSHSPDTAQPCFLLDLAAAVLRQCVFIQTMESFSWLYSPALNLTLQRILPKYSRFFTIMSEHPDRIAVPTHAVDLAWHTHQLSPASYYEYSIERTNGIFIDHDDKLGEGILTDAFELTKSEFAKLTQNSEEYGECMCWHCTTLLAIKESTPNVEPALAEQATLERIAGKQYKKLEDDFARAIRRAEARGKREPDKNLFLKNYRWLYNNAIPILKTRNVMKMARPDTSLITEREPERIDRLTGKGKVKKGKRFGGFRPDNNAACSGAIATNVAASNVAT